MANDNDDRRRDYDRPTGGGLDNKLLMAVAAGALFGSVGTYAYLSGSYRFVAPDKYDQLVRGAAPVADPVLSPTPRAATPTVSDSPQRAPSEDPRASRDDGESRSSPGRSDAASGDYIGEVEKFDTTDSPTKGAADAKVTLIEFSDFQCPACPHWVPELEEMMKTRASKVKLIYKFANLPDHNDARNASLAGQAANLQGKFWDMAALMFKNQDALKKADLVKYAAQVGLDVDKFKKDMESEAVRSVVDRDQKEGERSIARSRKAGIPAFFINGRRVDVSTPGQLETLLDRAIQ
ncbi:MAG: thioredoxin domain-containing protein [Deltaproteobacteria bacterium]|nr:thioredoxin domain-containing protein [Deltaproteobacteria bacterium]